MRVAWPLLERSWREEAPRHWVEARVGEVALLTNGYPFDSATFGPSGAMPLARIRDLGPGPLETWVPDPVPPAVVLRDGDVVIGMDGDFNLAWWNKGPAALNQRLCLLRAKEDRVLQRYLVYVLPRTLGVINDLTYFTTVKHLASDDLLAEKLLLPPVEEQRRIVEYLDTETARIDTLVTEQELLSSLLDKRDANALIDAVTGRAGWSGPWHTAGPWWLGPVPEHWAPHKVGTSFRVGSGTTPSSSNLDFYGGSYAWVTTGELRETVILETAKSVSDLALMEHSALRVWSPGAVVIAMYGATIGRVGRLGIHATVNQACCVLDDPTTVTSEFAYYWFQAFRRQIADLGRGGGQPNISQDTIRQLRIPAPSIEEQREIVQRIDESRAQSQAVRVELGHQIKLLQEHRQALITAAVTGGLEAVGRVA